MNSSPEVVCLCTHILYVDACVTAGSGRGGGECTHTSADTSGTQGSECYSRQPFMSSFPVNLNVPLHILRSDYHGNYYKTQKHHDFIFSTLEPLTKGTSQILNLLVFSF